MPTYGKNDFKESNVNYLNKDFDSLKQSLMDYAKSYFPNAYKDFNETSPGMMLLEMNAYVGDVLSFYIDQQYREMLLPLAEERRNIINIASMFGYKVKPIVPAYVDLTFSQTLDADGNDSSKVDYSTGGIFNPGVEVHGTNSNIVFETLEPIDFQITGSNDTQDVAELGSSDLAISYTLNRTVKAVSGKQKSISFDIGEPEKFKTIILPDTNVIDIISCVDSNGNDWYEVDFLAQDKVPIKTHYTEDDSRPSAYHSGFNPNVSETQPVPYSLQYIKTSKRFTRETNPDNTTSLVFGNGVLKNGQVVDDSFIDTQQIGVIVPGQYSDVNSAIDPLLGDEYSTLGETPNQTTLTITYRVGGGINQNVSSNTLTNIVAGTIAPGSPSAVSLDDLSVTNVLPARGGKDEETVDEIREKAKAFFTTQNRCVTKEDYEARVLNIPSKFGNIAKVYVSRAAEQDDVGYGEAELLEKFSTLQSNIESVKAELDTIAQDTIDNTTAGNPAFFDILFATKVANVSQDLQGIIDNDVTSLSQTDFQSSTFELSSVNIYVLGYDNNKHLIGNPMITYDTGVSDNVPQVLLTNIKNYLENFKILTDNVRIMNGYVVNFGVFFDVVAEQYADKNQVKLRCIDVIKDYFNIDNMQFNQPIYVSKLEYELMGVEGVRSLNHVTITQHEDTHPDGDNETLDNKTYRYTYSETAGPDLDGDGQPDGGYTDDNDGENGYGYFYDFSEQTGALSNGVIRPPELSTPAVFELKNPNQNIKGRVR